MEKRLTAKWRRTFDAGRRHFLNWLLGFSSAALGGAILYPILRFLSAPDVPEPPTHQVEAGLANDPAWVNPGYKIVRFGAEPVLVIRTREGEFRAFAATCTHLDCIVAYRNEQRDIWCNCHNGQFDLQGRVLAGPPPRPLEKFQVNLLDRGVGQPATVVVSRG
jgi:cytochrome b6-f complex iron-sulfur subunit